MKRASIAALNANDLGGWTRPAPRLYPHQWSWDSAFIAIGLAQVDSSRALRELESLFRAQWVDGRVPQIVYNPAAPPQGYFPDAARWACAELTPLAPSQPATSGLCQPPVQALAAWRIVETATQPEALRPRLAALYPRLLAWHRYLARNRDPERSGLLTIYHPWESGTDNSPRWDAPLAAVRVGPVPPYVRRDLQHVADPSHRPSNAEYDRYLWLVETLKQARYADRAIRRGHPFQVKDVLFSAIFAAASRSLAQLATWLGAPAADQAELTTLTHRTAQAIQSLVQPAPPWPPADQPPVSALVNRETSYEKRPLVLAHDLDLLTGRPIPTETFAGFAPLLLPDLPPNLAGQFEATLRSERWLGHPALVGPVLPSTSPASPAFRPRTYWRGPVWSVANWLIWWGLRQQRQTETAAALRAANLALLARPESQLAEYFEPTAAQPLGSPNQSWTAAVALDWLSAEGDVPERR